MRIADRHARNGQLCIAELQTFLSGTEYEEFLDWLLARRSSLFKQFDADDDMDLDVHEIAKAVELYAKELDEKRVRGGRKLAKIMAHVHRVAAKIRKAGSQDSAVRDNWFGLFKKYDQDGSGNLDFGEVKKVLRKDLKLTPFEVSEADIRVLWMLIDRDGSGLVTVGDRARLVVVSRRARARARFGSWTTLKPLPPPRFALRSASSRASCAGDPAGRRAHHALADLLLGGRANRAQRPRATARPPPTRSSRTPRRSRARCTTRAWAQDLRGYKVICGYSSLGDEAEALSPSGHLRLLEPRPEPHAPDGQVSVPSPPRTFPLPQPEPHALDGPGLDDGPAELLLRPARRLARRTESRYRYDDTSVPLSEHGAIRGANSHRYPPTRREHWRAMDIDQHRARARGAQDGARDQS